MVRCLSPTLQCDFHRYDMPYSCYSAPQEGLRSIPVGYSHAPNIHHPSAVVQRVTLATKTARRQPPSPGRELSRDKSGTKQCIEEQRIETPLDLLL